jgi:hypothetical protein
MDRFLNSFFDGNLQISDCGFSPSKVAIRDYDRAITAGILRYLGKCTA